jgi:DNA-binding transcriptional ArsR family regulator
MSDERLQRPDYDLADVVAADTPAQLKALGHPLRSLLVDLVLERAMTVTELAELVGKPRGTVAHHVDVLVAAGMLQVVRTRRVRALEERYYGRTGRTIMFPDPVGRADDLPFVADARREIDLDAPEGTPGGFTYRHARIPAERAAEFTERVMELALEFAQLPRGGDREYGFLVGVFPTNRLPSRGGSPEPEPDAAAATPAAARRAGRRTKQATGVDPATGRRTPPRASVRTAPNRKDRT